MYDHPPPPTNWLFSLGVLSKKITSKVYQGASVMPQKSEDATAVEKEERAITGLGT